MSWRSCTVASSACPPPPTIGHHAVALGEALGARARARATSPASSSPGMSGGRAGRRGVVARALVDVGAVEPGRAHPDEDLAGAGLRVGMLGDDDLAVADGGGAHGRGV